jgi:CRP-like cAMP-binding protein
VGDHGDHVLFLVAGNVRCTTATGKSFVYGPGTGVGGIDLVADKPRWYGAVAETPVLALNGYADAFVDMLEPDFSLAKGFLENLAGALAMLLTKRAMVGTDVLEQRRDVSSLRGVPVGA